MSSPYQQQVYFQDEMRFGTRTDLKRRWTPQGHRPRTPRRIGYAFSYLYLALNPFSGQVFAMILPRMSKQCFGLFLQEMNQDLTQPTLMIADRATTHQSCLASGTRLVLAPLPTACPELNPVERFFQEMRKQLANRVFDSLQQVEERVVAAVRELTASAQQVVQLTCFPYIRNAQS